MDLPTTVFELVIALVTASVPLFVLEVALRWKRIPSKGPYVLASALLLAVWGTVVYGSFIEPRKLVVVHQDVTIGEGEGSLRIALVSDTHFGLFRHADDALRLVEAVNAQRPDVVVLAGDLVSAMSGLSAFTAFAGFESTYGTFAVLGNSDYQVGAVDVRHRIESFGVEVLTNESVLLGTSGPPIRLIGVDDLWYGVPDWRSALEEVEDDAVTVLVSHNPDAAPVAEFYGIDLVLSGHTHGGQVRLPYVGAIPRLPTTIDRSFDQGLFRFGPTRLFITSGAGEAGTRARLFNPPEIAVLEVGS